MNLGPCTRTARTVLLSIFVSVFTLGMAFGQATPTEHPFTFNVGGGFTPLVGAIGNRLDNGWHLTVGAGYNIASPLSVSLQYTYHGLGVARSVINFVGSPDANARIWSITADPKLRIPTRSRFSPYIVGGVGYYRRGVDFTQPAILPVTLVDPFFGFLVPGVTTGNQVIARRQASGIGGSLGAGFQFDMGSISNRAQMFVESRYHYANTGSVPTRMVPVTVGIRF